MIYAPTKGLIAAGGFRNHPRYRGCVGHWPLFEGGGLKAFDISGFGNTGTLVSGPTWIGGLFGDALNFVGGADPKVSATFTKLPGYPFTLSAWSKATTGNNGTIRYVVSVGSDGTHMFGIGWASTNGGARIAGQNPTYTPGDGPDIGVNIWTHLVGVFATTTDRRLYVNGKLVVSDAVSVANHTTMTVMQIGDNSFSVVNEARVYNRTLSAAEVASLYNDPFLEFRQQRRMVFAAAAAAGASPRSTLVQQAVHRAASW